MCQGQLSLAPPEALVPIVGFSLNTKIFHLVKGRLTAGGIWNQLDSVATQLNISSC